LRQPEIIKSANSAPQVPSPPIGLALSCIPSIEASLLADVERLRVLRTSCADELSAATDGLAISQPGQDAIFASMLAYHFAPYGQSRETTFEALLHEKQLDCDNYVLLAGYILERLRPGASLKYVGFDGGAIGNHAEAFFEDDVGAIFLDPTIGVVATVNFDELLMGRVEGVRVIADQAPVEPAISSLRAKVVQAVVHGEYRPSDLLYYFSNRDDLIRFGEHTAALWDGDLSLLALHYPTPAAKALKKNLGLD